MSYCAICFLAPSLPWYFINFFQARCKCFESQAKSLQLQLDQKTNENAELTKICNELIEQQQTSLDSNQQ